MIQEELRDSGRCPVRVGLVCTPAAGQQMSFLAVSVRAWGRFFV
jgi:hypothetical protein